MFKLNPRTKKLIVFVFLIGLLLINLRVFVIAYPTMTHGDMYLPSGLRIARDFGTFYLSAWRLIHSPSQIYTRGNVTGDYQIGATPTQFKYLPSFSIIMLPFLLLKYDSAIVAWNVFQFLLLPVMAFMLYRCLKDKNILLLLGVEWIALVQPLPFDLSEVSLRHILFFQLSYFNQWVEGQSKVFLTFLIVGAYYFSKTNRTTLAGLLYGLSFFDPRFGVLALPLFVIINRRVILRFAIPTLVTLAATNFLFLYDGLFSAFLQMVETSGLSTKLYSYTYIPIYTILAITILEVTYLIWDNRMRVYKREGTIQQIPR